MSVARIFKVEQLDLLGDLPRRQPRPPLVHQLGEDAVRSALLHLAQPPKLRQLVVRHPHVGLLARAPNKFESADSTEKKKEGRAKACRTSSACTYVSVKGSNSAVGTAVRKLHGKKTQTSLPTSTDVGLLTARESEGGSSLVPTQ